MAASAQSYFRGPKKYQAEGREYTRFNNYVIFKQSFHHLTEKKDLYGLYPEEHWDLYKYSPTFALLFSIFAFLPNFLGLFLWNSANALILFLAIKLVPQLRTKDKAYILWFVLIELMTSMQNEQSNGLMAGLIILSFVFLEKNKYLWAALFIALTIFIKLFGIVAFSLFLLYPKRIKSIGYSLWWIAILAMLPLIVVSFSQLRLLYSSWLKLLTNDYSLSYGLSIMGWLVAWFNLKLNKMLIFLIGCLIFYIPFIRISYYKDFYFRLLALVSVLLWMVIFNHKAESPMFVIALSGVGIWYFSQQKKPENMTLLIFAFILTSLSPTDIFPKFLKDKLVKPLVLKVVPCIFIWFKLIYEMVFVKYSPKSENMNAAPNCTVKL
jgi:hypothetical protein